MSAKAADRKSIFITGAASGMGRATANLFHDKGWFVGAFDVNVKGLETLEKEIGSANCLAQELDVTDLEAYRRAIEAFSEATGGKMDILYNNAGIGGGGLFEQMPIELMMSVIRVNFIGVVYGIHLALPLLKATKNSLCFTTSSSSATFGMPGISIYSATKHAVKGLTESLSVELAVHGIRAADTLPGAIDTPLFPKEAHALLPKEGMFRLMRAEAVADAVFAAYHGDKIHWYVPEEVRDLDLLATRSPETVRDLMKNQGPFAGTFDKLAKEAANLK